MPPIVYRIFLNDSCIVVDGDGYGYVTAGGGCVVMTDGVDSCDVVTDGGDGCGYVTAGDGCVVMTDGVDSCDVVV